MRERLKKVPWKKIIKYTLLTLLIFAIYVAAGALLPFAFPHKENKDIISQYKASDYYSDTISCDKAYIVEDNGEALDIRLKMFEEAKESIVISTFDIREGESFSDMAACLLAAADRGVKVQIFVDGMYGTLNMSDGEIFYALGTNSNIDIKFYNTPNVLLPWTINGRMHDKYILIDNKLLLMGGRNTFDYFIGDYDGRSKGYDREVLVYNSQYDDIDSASVINDVWEYFYKIWDKSVCEIKYSTTGIFNKSAVKKMKKTLLSRYDTIAEDDRLLPFDYDKQCISINKATFVHNPTTIYAKEPLVWYQMKVLMLGAENNITIQTPYAVFSDEMYSGMKEIVKNQPNVKMLINSVAVGDNVMASSDYMNSKSDLIDTGANIYEYFGNHSCHAKSLIIDDDISVIGSYNFDMRSTYVDTENMLVINGQEFTSALEEKFDSIEKDSLLLDDTGHYVEKEGVESKSIKGKKKTMIKVISKVIKIVRYLV